MVPQFANQDQLSQIFFALAHPIRRQMLINLKDKELTVTEISQTFQVSLPAITRHLKVLEKAGFVKKTISAQERHVSTNNKPLEDILDWIGGYIPMWSASLEKLEKYIQNNMTDESVDE